MGLLTSTSSFLRYRIEDESQEISSENIRQKLKDNSFPEIPDSEMSESVSGWTTFENPFDPDFESDHIAYGNNIVFCLRTDKKSVPKKIVDKHIAVESKKAMRESGRDYLSKNEKKKLKEEIILRLSLSIPATPDIYEVLWIPDKKEVLFFSGQKSVNEVFETLFRQTFSLSLIRLFPYTKVYFSSSIEENSKNIFYNTKHTKIPE
ncbi:MAG: recombination-associated protein RdgC, partial [Thermodesulfobacteriota bacterium]